MDCMLNISYSQTSSDVGFGTPHSSEAMAAGKNKSTVTFSVNCVHTNKIDSRA